MHTRAAQHTVGSSTKPTLNLRGLSSLVDAGKSQPPKNNKNDMSVKEDAEAVVADARILKSLAAYLWPKDNPEFRRRVTLALSLLVASKVRYFFFTNALLGNCFAIRNLEGCDGR